MNTFLLIIIVFLLIICIVLSVFLVRKNKKVRVEKEDVIIDKKIEKIEKIDILDIVVPIKILQMGHPTLFQSCTRVFESFKALDYASKPESVLSNIEWHTWQISLLLALLKTDREVFIPNPKKIFHSMILEKSQSAIEEEMNKILHKYVDNVDINKTREELSNEIIWSCKEVSIIFCYMQIKK